MTAYLQMTTYYRDLERVGKLTGEYQYNTLDGWKPGRYVEASNADGRRCYPCARLRQ
ncbi:hypothetical protein JCM19235_1323 [Vibrio maritimus]|uniref:Uncharacterized protein n=1 Tax=Vibrio maritimus TaxID=990268 RepID=A0A090SUN4_9VIBR|nr:hypothetical protein JCM19235_1323 [Vibrio maritimus]